ncbi:MAG: hypothetical protein NZ529_10480 [Cytophagaceae bacterium]|nr:hypothetical protein [Cytophagaceae bacterium]MDW8457212.1 hypothetical protein [Cytophagaceae bacterium]
MNTLRSIILNEPLKNIIKQITFPYFKNKWKKNTQVQQWLKDGIIPKEELKSIVFEWERFGAPAAMPHKL